MYCAAPRLDRRLLEAIVRRDDPAVPMAETYRGIRADAANLDIPRPSYECCRLLITAARRERRRRRANRETLIRVALYLDGVEALDRIDPTPALRL